MRQGQEKPRSWAGAGAEAGEARSQAGAGHRAPEGQLNRLREFPIAYKGKFSWAQRARPE